MNRTQFCSVCQTERSVFRHLLYYNVFFQMWHRQFEEPELESKTSAHLSPFVNLNQENKNIFRKNFYACRFIFTRGNLYAVQSLVNCRIGCWCIGKYFFASSKQPRLQLTDNCTCATIPFPLYRFSCFTYQG